MPHFQQIETLFAHTFAGELACLQMGNWEAPTHLRPSTAPAPTVNVLTFREKPVTAFVANDSGHLINRKKVKSSFNALPVPGAYGAKGKRWPVTRPNRLGHMASVAAFNLP